MAKIAINKFDGAMTKGTYLRSFHVCKLPFQSYAWISLRTQNTLHCKLTEKVKPSLSASSRLPAPSSPPSASPPLIKAQPATRPCSPAWAVAASPRASDPRHSRRRARPRGTAVVRGTPGRLAVRAVASTFIWLSQQSR